MRPLKTEPTGPRLFTRAEALEILKIGETTLYWLQRTGKLSPIRIGSRVLFTAAEIRRLVTRGATLTEAEKQAAVKRDQSSRGRPCLSAPPRRGRPREQAAELLHDCDVLRYTGPSPPTVTP
jgi:hypothetical protein